MKDVVASIQARLKNFSRKTGLDFVFTLRLYMQEGLLRRISRSTYNQSFYLKGGLLLLSISGFTSRPTQDIDLLGKHIPGEEKYLRKIMTNILTNDENDGLIFKTETITFEDITEGAEYHGKRMKISCYLGNMNTILKVDFGFGDTVYPAPVEIIYPELLNQGGFLIYSYPLEAVIAEKFDAMIALDTSNSRMKDFYDIYKILKEQDVSNPSLAEAIKQTLRTRGTVLPENPAIFTDEFKTNSRNLGLWQAFLKRMKLEEIDFQTVLTEIKQHLEPIYKTLVKER
jgi:predicted nucleotidyltransferase component of viral defense system